jgi:hypothetical protein
MMNDGHGFRDEDLLPLEGMRHVECLFLSFNPITDEGIPHLSHMKSLTVLALAGTRHLTCLPRPNCS